MQVRVSNLRLTHKAIFSSLPLRQDLMMKSRMAPNICPHASIFQCCDHCVCVPLPSTPCPSFEFCESSYSHRKRIFSFDSHFPSLSPCTFHIIWVRILLRGRCQRSCNRTAMIRRKNAAFSSGPLGMLSRGVSSCVGLTQAEGTFNRREVRH